MLRSRFSNDVFFDEEPRKKKVQWKWILLAILSLVAFRIILGHGIKI
jgi:hypothetical protein